MRILIVGGTRFIGAHVARQFFDRGSDVTVFHRGMTENPILPAVHHIRDAQAEYPILRYPEQVTSVDWDAVVHMVLMGEADALAATNSFTGRVGRLVMVSSGDVYRAYGRLIRTEPGPPDPIPLAEDAPLRSVFYPYRSQAEVLGRYAYDYEKVLAETAILENSERSAVVLRLPKVYGPGDNANLATIYGFAGVPHWRWTHGHVKNVAHAIVIAASHPNAIDRVFNVGEADTPTMAERLTRLPTRKAAIPKLPPFDFAQSIVYDTARIREELGYSEILDEASAMCDLVSKRSTAEPE